MKINLGKHFNDTEVTKEQLQAINDLLGIENSKTWKPKDGEWYYTVTGLGGVKDTLWTNDFQDNDRYDLGNVFETQEQALFARDKQVFLTKMKRDFIENSDEVDWGNKDQKKYFLRFDNRGKVIQIDYFNSVKCSAFNTTNHEWLKQYIKDNEEDIKKYYFEIKENEYE